MRLSVSLFGSLRKYVPGDSRSFELDFKQGASVKDLTDALSIPEKEPRIILVNGRPASDQAALSPDDKVVFLSPLEGG